MEVNYNEKDGLEAIHLREMVSVRFRAYKRKFQLSLYKDRSIISPSTKIVLYGENTSKMNIRNTPNFHIYEGTVNGEEQSSVTGYFHRNLFIGRIDNALEIYHLELASVYLKGDENKNKVMIFKQEKDHLPKCSLNNGTSVCKETLQDIVSIKTEHFANRFNFSNIIKEYILKVENKLICDVEVLADHTLVEFMNGDRARIVAEMLYHMKLLDKVFRYTDLDNDLEPEGIGFSVEKITIIENKYHPHYPLNFESHDTDNFADKLQRLVQQKRCLLIAFCHRDFEGSRGPANRDSICEGWNNTGNIGYNVAFVTTNKHDKLIPRDTITLNLIHHIGHCFGSPNDDKLNKECSPGNANLGNFIMYPETLDGTNVNNWLFSPCSKKFIKNTVEERRECLTRRLNAKCGNAITEIGEECDCGSRESCSLLDPCCNPPGTNYECNLKEEMSCSFREGKCCKEDCTLVPKVERRICFVNTPCRKEYALCDGISSYCPEIPLSDGTSCGDPSYGTSCHFGHCTSNVCEDNSMQHCICPYDKECHVCCMGMYNRCQSSEELNLFRLNKQIYTKIPGTLCLNNTGMCLRSGICSIFVKPKNNWSRILWMFMHSFVFLCILVGLLLCYYVIRYLFFSKKRKRFIEKNKPSILIENDVTKN
ncbi:disintegrin and metalloproteinase domain-containing protein 10-like [Centruroides sculpturatus]|uniref:disintegrin and metalloproteinase domain-containing protein 10-like n=1 Tax=Centruroides sculpturatus TaxID=218467 RepID=UPI000C6E85CA|nr:disintegrin and metalloproteinase domain-containing protein 10-like [Centruroides sculpturatus]